MAAPENEPVEHGSIEVYFAKKLANNDKKIRDRAVKRMRVWLSSRPGESFSDLDMMKLWKGLFYCMWFSDKLLVQEDLADSMAHLIHSLKDLEAVCKFINAFFLTMGREWHGIDVLRLDKFYMLIRRVLREVFAYAQQKIWDEEVVDGISATLVSGPCNPKTEAFPDGVRMFIIEIFLEELSKQINDTRPLKDVLTQIFHPFIILFAHSESGSVRNTVTESVFQPLLGGKKQGAKPFETDLEKLASKLFEEGSKETVRVKNRKGLFYFSKVFKEAAAKKAKEEMTGITEVDNYKIEKIGKTKNERKKKAKKRKSQNDETSIKQNKKKKQPKSEKDCADKETSEPANTETATVGNGSLSNDEMLVQTEDSTPNDCETSLDDKERDGVENDNDENGIKKKLDFETSLVDVESNSNKKVKERKNSKAKKQMKKKKASTIDPSTSIEESVDTADSTEKSVPENETQSEAKTGEVSNGASSARRETLRKRIKKGSKTTDTNRTKRITRQTKELDAKAGPESNSAKKKVVFELSKNAVTSISNLKINPANVFTPEQKPKKGVLKTPTSRRRASDFF